MADPNSPAASPLETDIYAVFVDEISQASADRIVGNFSLGLQKRFKRFHLMFQSSGGTVSDGVMLYNYFKRLSNVAELTLYNAGQVSSAACTAFLGARRRVANKRSTFMLHKSHASPQIASAAKLEKMARNLVLDDEWRRS